MCGRFTQMMSWEDLVQLLDGELDSDMEVRPPHYNIAPTMPIMVIAPGDQRARLTLMPWGGKQEHSRRLLFNARSERYLHPRDPFWKQWQRCLIPANGFYEWRRTQKGKEPNYISVKSRNLFALGGLYRGFQHGDLRIDSAVIMTTQPNAMVAEIHDRMPVILDPKHHKTWLDPDASSSDIAAAAGTYPAEDMASWAVSTVVNKAANNVLQCIEPVILDADSEQLDLL